MCCPLSPLTSHEPANCPLEEGVQVDAGGRRWEGEPFRWDRQLPQCLKPFPRFLFAASHVFVPSGSTILLSFSQQSSLKELTAPTVCTSLGPSHSRPLPFRAFLTHCNCSLVMELISLLWGVSDVSSCQEPLEIVYNSLLIAPPLAFVTTLDGVFPFIPCGSHKDSALRSSLRKELLPISQDSLCLWAKVSLFSGGPGQ